MFKACQRAGCILNDLYFTGGVWAIEGETLFCPPVEINLYIPAEV
jgi:hypothetical protein